MPVFMLARVSWMHGVRVDGAATLAARTIATARPPSIAIEVRNPPVLSLAGATVGLCMIALGVFALSHATDVDPVISGLRVIAGLVLGLGITAAALGALRAHTRIRVEGDRIVVERARKAPPSRHALSTAGRVEADPVTGDVRLVEGDRVIVLAPALLPEQAALVATALGRAWAR